MDNLTIQKVKDAIAKGNNIGIVVGQDPTLDEMAAGLSLYLLLKQLNKKAVIASPSNPIVEISSLVGINKVQTSLGGDAGDLVVSFPYVEGEIEKVSYTLENEFLNIIVKAGEKGLSFDEKDVKYVRGSGSVDLLFVVGTARLSDLGELVSGDKLSNAKIINIDNKPDNQKFGDVLLVSPEATSVCELIGDLVLSLGFNIDQDIAQNLLSGLVESTNNFQNQKTTALAFEIASFAVKSGARRDDVNRQKAASFMTTPKIDNQQRQEKQTFEDLTPERPQRFKEDDHIQTEPEQRIQRLKEDLHQEGAINEGKAPIDWLSPKVYKGSSNV